MPIRHLVLTGLLAAAAAASFAQPTPPTLAPIAPVDLGEVRRGDSPEATIELENLGQETLTLRVAAAKYMEVTSLTAELAPGAKGKLVAKLHTLTAENESEWKIALRTNDPTQEVVVVVIKADVQIAVAAKPVGLRWVTVQGEPLGTLDVTLQATDLKPFRVGAVRKPYEALGVVLEPVSPDQSGAAAQWLVKATLNSNSMLGPIVGLLEIEVDHPGQSVVSLPLSGFVRPAVAFAHPSYEVGTLARAEFERGPITLTLRFFASRPMPVVRVDSKLFEAVAVPVEGDIKRMFVQLRPKPELKNGPFEDTVSVHFADPLVPVLTTTISGAIE